MSDTDSFIQEVTEEVRQDRMFALWKRYGPFIIGAVVLVLAGSAAWSWKKSSDLAAARDRGDAFMALPDDADAGAYDDLVKKIDGPANILARLRAADAKLKAGDSEGAITLYRAVADQSGLSRDYRDLALLQIARLQSTGADAGQVIDDLEPLVQPDAPYRLLALELRAGISLGQKKTAQAQADLKEIIADPASTPSLRARAQEMLPPENEQ